VSGGPRAFPVPLPLPLGQSTTSPRVIASRRSYGRIPWAGQPSPATRAQVGHDHLAISELRGRPS